MGQPTSFMSCSTRGSWSVVMLTQRGSGAIGEPAPSCNTWGGGEFYILLHRNCHQNYYCKTTVHTIQHLSSVTAQIPLGLV